MTVRLKSWLRHLMPRAVGVRRIVGGPLRGLRILTSWHDYPAAILGRTEGPLLAWFEKNVLPGETWLDVGAHYGYTALALSRLVGLQGRVVAFEPVLGTAGNVAHTRRLNRIAQLTIIPCALAAPQDLELRQLPLVRGMVDSTKPRGETCETILAAGLDWLWPRICGDDRRVDGIKVDVQGMEIEALRGMRETLQTYRPKLVLEPHPGVDRDMLLDLLESVGYRREGTPVESLPGETTPQYHDDRSYAFWPAEG